MHELILKKNEERRLLAGHLWIYSNEIDTKISPLKNFTAGQLVNIKTANNRVLGTGYINPHTLLCARLLSTTLTTIDCDFFVARIKQALLRRTICFAKPFYRLIFSESDFLPGLIVDRFDTTLVIQINTAGMESLKETIIEALIKVVKPTAILLRNNSSFRATEGLTSYIETAYGKPEEFVSLEENNITFNAPIKTGQKTGWFYDQRINRARLIPYVKNKSVLDVFSYCGAFSITAAIHHAKHVTAIDVSEGAIKQINHNATLNKVNDKITPICADAFLALKDFEQKQKHFEVIILDPPAFIKKQKDIAAGREAYLRLHRMALRVLATNGILLTTSCSLHLARDMLLDVIRFAGINEKRQVSIIEQLHQAPDHPIHPTIMETDYLKGFIALVL